MITTPQMREGIRSQIRINVSQITVIYVTQKNVSIGEDVSLHQSVMIIMHAQEKLATLHRELALGPSESTAMMETDAQ